MQVQKFVSTSGTLCDFQDFYKRLESAIEDQLMDNKSNNTSSQDKGSKNHCCNNNNIDKGSKKKHSVLHRYNPTHPTKYFCTLKRKWKRWRKVTQMKIAKTKRAATTQENKSYMRSCNLQKKTERKIQKCRQGSQELWEPLCLRWQIQQVKNWLRFGLEVWLFYGKP